MSAELIVSSLKELAGRKELDRYDANLCLDIRKKLDSKLNENGMSISEKSLFVSTFLFF